MMIAVFKQFLSNMGVVLRTPIYFDANATTPMDVRVQKFMASVQKKRFGNPSSLHLFGSAAREIVETSRRHVAHLIGAEPSEIVFTSGGTEANNTVIRSAANGRTKGHFITSAIEHPSVLLVFRALEEEGFDLTIVGVDEGGCVRVDEIERAIRPDTLLISVMHVNNELGTIQPIAQIGALAAARRISFHCDAVQSLGKLPIDLRTLPVDYLTCSAHKINGPKGAGAIYTRRGSSLNSLLKGGHQERLLRPGTESVAGIGGFGEACRIVASIDHAEYRVRMARIQSILIEGIGSIFPDARLNGTLEQSVPTTLNVTLPGIPNSETLAYLDFFKIAVSVGSACVAGSDEVSHVLAALGVSDEDIRCSFRISFGRFNTEAEAHSFVAIMRRFAHERSDFFAYMMPGDLLLRDCASGTILVADLRDQAERDQHPPIPHAILMERTMKQMRRLPHDREVVLLCEDGYLSNLYGARLRRAGWKNVKSLLGGYKRWRQYHRDDYYFNIKKDVSE